MVYTPLSPASHRKVCGSFGRAKQSHEQRSTLTYRLLERIAVLCCLYVMAESLTALLEGLHGLSFPSALIFSHCLSGARMT